MSRPSPSRRHVLQLLAALPVTLPFARMLRADDDVPDAPPKRLVLFMQNNGTQQGSFWPQGVFGQEGNLSSPILDSLWKDAKTKKDNGLRAKTNLIKGVYMPFETNGTNANQHDLGFARMFTGEKLVSRGGQPWGGGPSVDQILAQAWKLDSLTLGVLASQTEPHPKPGFDHRVSFSYQGAATLKYPRRDPLDVYRYLFPATNPDMKRRQSVLDAVAGNMGEISQRLGAAERAKLDYHMSAIRDVERRLTAQGASCTDRPLAPPNYLAIDPNSEVNVDTYIPQMVDNMIDLAVVGLRCGITRIATMQFGFGGGKWRFGWQGINMNCHDDVAHLDTSDNGSSFENTRRVMLMNQYYASCVARLATQLDAIPEGNGTMLDNTLIVWANELGRGDHSMENIPIVLIGKAGGAITRGGRVVNAGRQVFNRLGCTILNAMGVESPGFGDAPNCGPFSGLI